ncbi:MAG: sensor histidine kinase [Candidatus Cyclobacteriaceae bacterium M3_2C_046]
MSKERIYWILQITGWTLYSFLNIFFFALQKGSATPRVVIGYLLIALSFIISTHLYRLFIRKKHWMKQIFSKIALKLFLTIVVFSIFNYLFQYLISLFLQFNDNETFYEFFINTLNNITITIVLYIIWTLFYFMYHYVDSYNKSLKYDAAINEIELNKLKSQLNPHFIFNALNSIRALVDEDPNKAKNAITQLSNILRNSLIMDKKRLTDFNEEIRTVKDYIDLETIRFEERLKTEISIDPEAKNFQIPPLMIQTLVENGIKHGISSLKEGGYVKIRAIANSNYLTVQIRNSGQYLNGVSQKQEGYGISNTIQRLKLIYGENASFNITNENDQFVLTELKIPKMI